MRRRQRPARGRRREGGLLRALWADRRGSVAILFAVALVPLLLVGAFAVDLGNVFDTQRALQGATDLAAIAAASDPADATAAARANAVLAGFQSGEVATVQTGTYQADLAIAVAKRFATGPAATANAARVTMSHRQTMLLAGIEAIEGGSGAGTPVLTAAAIATRSPVAASRIGDDTGVAPFGLLDAMFGGAFGTTLTLCQDSYDTLQSTEVDLFAFGQAIAAASNRTGGTYAQAVTGTIGLGAYLSALERAAPSVAGIVAAFAPGGAAPSIDLSALIEYGPYASLSVSLPAPAIHATVPALALLQAAATLGSGSAAITASSPTTVSGISAFGETIGFGAPASGQTLIALDRAGASVRTGTLRLALSITFTQTVDTAPLLLPLYIELAAGKATLSSLSCTPLDGSRSAATLATTPGNTSLWIGTVTASQLGAAAEPSPVTATLLNDPNPKSTVTGLEHAAADNEATTSLGFSASDMSGDVSHPTTSSDAVATLLASAISGATIQASGSASASAKASLVSRVRAALNANISPAGQLITGILQGAGIGLGGATGAVTGPACGAAHLAG